MKKTFTIFLLIALIGLGVYFWPRETNRASQPSEPKLGQYTNSLSVTGSTLASSTINARSQSGANLSSTTINSSSSTPGSSLTQTTTLSSATGGLICWITFDNQDISGSNLLDKSGQGKTCVIHGTTSNKQIGVIGQALKTGTGVTYFSFDSPNYCTTSFQWTVSMWMYPRGTSENLFWSINNGGTNGYNLYDQPGVKFEMSFDAGGTHWGVNYNSTTPKILDPKTWNLFTITYVSTTASGGTTTLNIYNNGVFATSTTGWKFGYPLQPSQNYIGYGNDNTYDDFRVYNRVLTPQEIYYLYKQGR